jgi:hypothetical protein
MIIEGKTFLSGQRFRIGFPKMGTIIPLALTDRDFNIRFRAGQHQTLTLAPEGLTLEIVAGAVELIREKDKKGAILGYTAVCTSCHAESKRQKVQSPRLETWANAHRCNREMVDAPDARKSRKK